MRRHGPALGILGGPSSIGTALGDQGEDMDAITQYVTVTRKPKTVAAVAKQDEYKAWIDTVSWWNKNYDRPTYDHARNLRNEFDELDAVTPAEKAAVALVHKTGLTTEEMEGGASRVSSEGRFSEKEAPAPELPSWAKWTIAAAVGVGVLYALGKVTTLAQIFAGKGKPPSPSHAANPWRGRRRARR